jgi:hypothetical protein
MSSIGVTVSKWSAGGFGARLLALTATAIAWTVVSLQTVLLHPSYWDPVTISDWFSIWAYTSAWLLTATALVVFREVARGNRLSFWMTAAVAIACAATGIANALEDGFEVPGLGSVYVLGFVTASLGMLLLAAIAWFGETRRLSFVPALGGLAAATMVSGGGVLAIPAWIGLAVVLARARRRTSEAATPPTN